jgi:hypothetical protein
MDRTTELGLSHSKCSPLCSFGQFPPRASSYWDLPLFTFSMIAVICIIFYMQYYCELDLHWKRPFLAWRRPSSPTVHFLAEGVDGGFKQGYFRNVNWVWATIFANFSLGPKGTHNTWALNLQTWVHMSNCPRREPYFSLFSLVWITKAFNLDWLLNLWERGKPQNKHVR